MSFKFRSVVFFFALACLAQGQNQHDAYEATTTEGTSNGRLWRSLSSDAKIIWLRAYRDGLIVAFMSTPEVKGRAELVSHMRVVMPDILSYAEIRAALDRFFDAPENGPFPIGDALITVNMKANGIDQSAIDRFVAGIRQGYTKGSDKEK